MAIVLAGVAGFVYIHLRTDLQQSTDMGLRSRAQVIVSNSSPDPSLGNGRRLIDPDEAFAQVLTPSARIVETTPGVAAAPLVSAAVLAGVHRPTFLDRRPRGLDPSRLLVVPLRRGAHSLFAVVGATLSNNQEALGTVVVLFAVASPVALALCSLIGWLLAGAALRPVERMRRQAEAISPSDPTWRLPIPTTDDTLSRLAATLNATYDRLQEALERERRFVDDASHELRTPLTILKAEVDTALAGDGGREELLSALRGASEEINHLVRIAEGLLVLARAEQGQIPTHRSPTSIRDLLDERRDAFQPRASAGGVELSVDAPDAVIQIDRTRVRQAVDNLIDNALRHTPPGGAIGISATTGRETVTIAVEDEGPGLPPSVLAGGLQPFNRGPAAHEDGAGLGLAIVRAIAEAHGGTATVTNLPGRGARVTMVLPTPASMPMLATSATPSPG